MVYQRTAAVAAVIIAAVAIGLLWFEPVERWGYSVRGENGAAVLETEGFTLIVEDEETAQVHPAFFEHVAPTLGTDDRLKIQVAGPGTFSLSGSALGYSYQSGIAEIEFFGHRAEVVDHGGTLRIGGEVYDLADRPVIRIGADGASRVVEE